jgi:hypothetical protein
MNLKRLVRAAPGGLARPYPTISKNQLKAIKKNAKTADLGAQMNVHGNSEDGLTVVLLPVTHTPVVQLEWK